MVQRFKNIRPFLDTIYNNEKSENFSLFNTLPGKAGGTLEQSENPIPEKDNRIEVRLTSIGGRSPPHQFVGVAYSASEISLALRRGLVSGAEYMCARFPDFSVRRAPTRVRFG